MVQCRVLIVDDEEDTRELLSASLSREGMFTQTAKNGKEALTFIDNSFDVLVTDIVMPEMDGISLLQETTNQELQIVKIVITSFADKENVKAALNAGADYLIEKPFNGSQLKSVIDNLYDSEFYTSRNDPSNRLLSNIFQRRLMSLPITETEKRIVSLIVRGASNETISIALGISHQTVKNRVSLIFRKLGISSRQEIFAILFPV